MESQDWEELKRILEAGESERVEFKETSFLKDTEEVAGQLTSFANRNGGKILIGVKDNGELEREKINRDKALLQVLNVAQDKTSPPVEISSQFLESTEGDVLVVDVRRRKGIPHAVVKSSRGQIKERIYYIRNGSSKRLVNDTTLKWLFEHFEEPPLEYRFYTCIHYWRDRLQIAHDPVIAPPIYEFRLSGLLDISKENLSYILEDESTRVQRLFIQLSPYVVLLLFARPFGYSWLITIGRRIDQTSYSPLKRDVDKEMIRLEDIPFPPNSSLISHLSFDLKSLFNNWWMRGIAVPPGTKIKIDFDDSQAISRSCLQLTRPNSFNFKLSFEQNRWDIGVAPGHPLESMISGANRVVDVEQLLQSKIASVGIRCKFTGEFEFPDIEDPLFEDYRHWGNSIIDILKNECDWDAYVERLRNRKLDSIERDIKEILTILRQH